MQAIDLPYGKGTVTLHVEESRLMGVLRPSHTPGKDALDQEALVTQALEHPIASRRLCELAKDKRRVLVITSDHTRPVPSRITLPLYLKEIRAGNPDAEIVILIATGMHRPTTEAELRAKFGDGIVDHERIVVHRAEDAGSMVRLGTLPSGGELWLNKLVTWADLIVSEGFIEPHFFAGFSGGRKSILPGIASRKTVLYNHNALFIKDHNAVQGSLQDNPIHKDMLFAAKTAGLAFILNVLIDADKRIIAAVAGEPEEAHRQGCALCARMTSVTPVSANIVVTGNGGYPLDQNVYQAVKSMTAAEACVDFGGVIIICAALGDGHGGEAFYRWFADRDGPEAVAKAIEGVPPEETRMDQWEAQILARVMNKAVCIFVTGEENRRLIESMHMLWAPTPDAALTKATRAMGESATVAVIPDGVGVILR